MTATQSIREHLRSIHDLTFGHPDSPKRRGLSVHGFLAERGLDMRIGEDVARGIRQECFRNAFNLAMNDPRYVYVEGYAAPATTGFPVAHAWVVNRLTGLAADPTWPHEAIRGASYLGVPVQARFVVRSAMENDAYPGIFFPYGFLNRLLMDKTLDEAAAMIIDHTVLDAIRAANENDHDTE